MIVLVDYASPSAARLRRARPRPWGSRPTCAAACGSTACVRQHGFVLRIALQALGEAIWSNDTWIARPTCSTRHHGASRPHLLRGLQPGPVRLRRADRRPARVRARGRGGRRHDQHRLHRLALGALGEMRTEPRHHLSASARKDSRCAPSRAGGRFEKKVDLPESWVRGFLQVQAAMGMPGTRLNVKPIDLLAALRFLRHSKAKVSPRALRYEFEPGQDARLVLEPWEHVVPLEGAEHNYTERKTTRVWGRRRLKLIEGLLPFAEGVDIYLKGRALPSFYAVKLPGMTFLLGLTGWSGSGLHRHRRLRSAGRGRRRQRRRCSSRPCSCCASAITPRSRRWRARSGIEQTRRARAGAARAGRAGPCSMSRPRRYRHRELFEMPADEATYFPARSPPRAGRRAHRPRTRFASRAATPRRPRRCDPSRTPTPARAKQKIVREITYRDWRVIGAAGDRAGRDRRQRHGQHHLRPLHLPAFRRAPDEPGAVRAHAGTVQGERGAADRSAIERAVDRPSACTARKQPSRWEVDGAAGGRRQNEKLLRSPRVRQDLPASYATVLRRGGFLSLSHRHGSHVRNEGRPRVQSLVSGWPPARDCAVLCRRRRLGGARRAAASPCCSPWSALFLFARMLIARLSSVGKSTRRWRRGAAARRLEPGAWRRCRLQGTRSSRPGAR